MQDSRDFPNPADSFIADTFFKKYVSLCSPFDELTFKEIKELASRSFPRNGYPISGHGTSSSCLHRDLRSCAATVERFLTCFRYHSSLRGIQKTCAIAERSETSMIFPDAQKPLKEIKIYIVRRIEQEFQRFNFIGATEHQISFSCSWLRGCIGFGSFFFLFSSFFLSLWTSLLSIFTNSRSLITFSFLIPWHVSVTFSLEFGSQRVMEICVEFFQGVSFHTCLIVW